MNIRSLFFKHVAQTSEAPMLFEVERAKGVYLFDKNEKEYIDFISGIPPFMEIEGPGEKEVMKYAKLLGFSKDDIKNWTGSQVIEHYGIKH